MVLIAFQKLSRSHCLRSASCAIISIIVREWLSAFCLSAADFDMARIHREAASPSAVQFNGWKDHGAIRRGMGSGHYLVEQGFRQYTINATDLAGGHFIISPAQAVPVRHSSGVGRCLCRSREEHGPPYIPIRLMNQEAHAGFYSSNWEFLPFSFRVLR